MFVHQHIERCGCQSFERTDQAIGQSCQEAMSLQRDPEEFEKKILHKFANLSNKRILEIGCGEGRLTWKYASASNLVIGIKQLSS
jgi:tRNA G46 methylase TrmB